MALEDFPVNLKLLCSYGKSVTDICQTSNINRQQFTKYLSGQSQPSLQTLRRICDFFGIDDHEIFLDHEDFISLIRVRPPKLGQQPDQLHEFIEQLARTSPTEQSVLDKYVGFYHTYFMPDSQSGEILCNLYSIYKRDNAYFTKQIERHPNSEYNTLPKVIKYSGIMASCGDRLICYESEVFTQKSIWNSIIYTSDYDTPTTLTGIASGITPESAHSIQSYRIAFEYLGRNPDLRKALKKCQVHDVNTTEISDYIKYCINNSVLETDTAFAPRF